MWNKKYKIVSEAYYENEIDGLFGDDVEHIYEWSEGVGRGLTNYDIFKSNEKYILRISDYGFDGYNNKYYIINKSNQHGENPQSDFEIQVKWN